MADAQVGVAHTSVRAERLLDLTQTAHHSGKQQEWLTDTITL